MKDRDIFRAAGAVSDALLDSLHMNFGEGMLSRSEAQHKIKRIRSASHQRSRASVYLKRVAAVILTLTLSSGILLAFSEDARAYVTNWIKEISQNMTVYHFYEEKSNDRVASVQIKHMAKGYFEKSHSKYGPPFSFIFENEEGGRLTIDCYRKDKLSIHLDRNAELSETVMIDGNEGEFYGKTAEEKECILIWTNTGQNLAYVIIGDLDKEEMIKIAEGVYTKVYQREGDEDAEG